MEYADQRPAFEDGHLADHDTGPCALSRGGACLL